MDFAYFLRAVFGLAVTLGLLGLAAVALRRYGPGALARFGAPMSRERRLAVVETLVLDPSRRLVLVACDGHEQLILLGEGRVIGPVAARKGRG
ncbi:flagellar biosynthetic protein FliO [Phenylobacterium sp.]|uniref:flagellar biosynthetic protein FliO n=1 Tax=Phenylobacterium sp. TaxID=1871053 RepID=UPI00261887AB|nr:flagellar biosynthetic protein FliO [Phenylobacterium sp.]